MRERKSKPTRTDDLYPLLFSGHIFVLCTLGLAVGVLQWIYFKNIDVLSIYIVSMMAVHKDGAFAPIGLISILMAIIFGVNGVPWVHNVYIWIVLGIVIRKLPEWDDTHMFQCTFMYGIVILLYEMLVGPMEIFGNCILHPYQFLEFWSLEYSRVFNDAIRMVCTAVFLPCLPLLYKVLDAAAQEEIR